MMRKYIYIIIASLFSSVSIFSQDKKHETSVAIGGGLSTLDFSSTTGNQKAKMGFNAGVGYTYYVNENWGLQSGLEFAAYNAKISDVNLLSCEPNRVDIDNDNYHYYSHVDGYAEKQKALYINIPVMAHFQTNAFSGTKYYASAGFKFGIPIKGEYEGKGDSFLNKGWYTERENWVSSQKFAGFGLFNDRSVKKDIDLKIAYMLSLETGLKWALPNNWNLYTGIYMDYGLNDIVDKGHTNSFVIRESAEDMKIYQ